MRNISILITIMTLVLVVEGCTITHKFGPFYGKVVDAETGEPIEGAAVVVWFSTKSPSMGGTVWKIADAVEALTDAKGEFRIPPHRINLFKAMASWDDECQVSIFKPGYAVYPGNSKSYSSYFVEKGRQSFSIPEDDYIIVHLPKLTSIKERKENLYDIRGPSGIDFNTDKIKNLRRLKSEERVNVGLQPYKEWKK